ncbi:MAG: nitrate ABC transporter permease [Aquisalimonadaceae bacterium]
MSTAIKTDTFSEETSAVERRPVGAMALTGHAAVPPAPAAPASASGWLQGDALRGLILSVVLPMITFGIIIALWSFVHLKVAPDLPGPMATFDEAVYQFSDPFYDNGPNDMGIGWQVLYSLGRVLAGFGLAIAVAIPMGFLMGMSRTCERAWQPLVQILRPVSPLAWLPIGLLVFQAVNPSAIFVIFITCIWPTLLNTAAGVKAIPDDYMNVARVLRLNGWEIMRRILLPATLPHIITGMRLSLGIAWMVIVAAEMLTGGIGIGFFVWDEWNNLKVESIIVAIFVIGMVGIALEMGMTALQRFLDYGKA